MLFNTWKELVAGRLLGCVFPRGTSTWDVVWTLVQRKFVLCWLGQDKRLAQCWQLCKHPEGCEIWHRDEMENLRPLTTSWEHWQGWGNQTLRGQGSQLLQKCTFADIKSAVQAWPWNPQLLQKILIIKPSIFYPSTLSSCTVFEWNMRKVCSFINHPQNFSATALLNRLPTTDRTFPFQCINKGNKNTA